MTLSEFLKEKQKRTQLPSKSALEIDNETLKRSQLPSEEFTSRTYDISQKASEEPIETDTNSLSPVIGYTSINVIHSMLNDSVSQRNFNMSILNEGGKVNPKLFFENTDLIMNGLDSSFSNSIAKTESSSSKILNKGAETFSKVISAAGRQIRNDDYSSIKDVGLAADGFSGKAQSATKDKNGLVHNIEQLSGTKLSDSDKESFRKIHLRNYWKIATTENLRPTTPGLTAMPKGASSISSAYRDLLNKRLSGVTDSQSSEGSFLTGYGLSKDEYKALMLNDSINGDAMSTTLENTLNSVAYGMVAKKDGIIDTGRFTYLSNVPGTDTSDLKWDSMPNASTSYYKPANVKSDVIFNISTFGADPAMTPFFRKQILSLGDEVNFANTYADIKYVTTNGFNIKIINYDSNVDPGKHSLWKFNDTTRGAYNQTSIYTIAHRFPDFMGNMSYVFFEFSEAIKTINSDIKYGLPGSVVGHIQPARVESINIKMPELKIESISFSNREIPVISSMLNMSHQGSITIRIDENLEIWREILASSGIILKHYSNNTEDSKYSQYQIDNNGGKVGVTTLRNSSNRLFTWETKGQRILQNLDMDLYVAYDLISGFLPLSTYTDASTPYSKNVINYQHDNTSNLYSRYYILRGVRFLGTPDIDLEKDTETISLSFDFTFKCIDEQEYGHQLAATGDYKPNE